MKVINKLNEKQESNKKCEIKFKYYLTKNNIYKKVTEPKTWDVIEVIAYDEFLNFYIFKAYDNKPLIYCYYVGTWNGVEQ